VNDKNENHPLQFGETPPAPMEYEEGWAPETV